MRDPDPRVVDRARSGDPAAFEQIVRSCQADIYRFVLHLVRRRSMAEDVTQEAFLRAYRFLGGFRGDTTFGAWLFTIARNCAMDALRAEQRIVTVPAVVDERTPPDDPSDRAALDAALASVSREHREAFLLVEVLGLSCLEAADVLGVAVGTVKSRMFRARKALAQAIAATASGDQP
jgi:RNA polymerase sigma-70 factor (ECF subfamily)